MRLKSVFAPFAPSPSTSSGRTVLALLFFIPAIAVAQTHTQYPGVAPAPSNEPLRVCADPNDLPFSNRAEQGFENKLAAMLAQSTDQTVAYTWAAQQKQFLRDTLDAGKCDVVMGLPTADHERGVLTTDPYYRSAYALVYRADAPYQLKSLEIGVHATGDDWVDLPGGATLAHRGIVKNVHIYKLFSDFSKPNPSSDLIDAVAHGDVDVAIAWGPMAGYFATREPVKLKVVPLTATDTILPFQFSISMAVRHDDTALRDKLNAFLQTHRASIRDLLTQYGVPQLRITNPSASPLQARLARKAASD